MIGRRASSDVGEAQGHVVDERAQIEEMYTISISDVDIGTDRVFEWFPIGAEITVVRYRWGGGPVVVGGEIGRSRVERDRAGVDRWACGREPGKWDGMGWEACTMYAAGRIGHRAEAWCTWSACVQWWKRSLRFIEPTW